ncbi:MAG: CHAD domain-containing protein [Aeoliella sp.]
MADFDKWISDARAEMSVDEVARIALAQRLGAVVHFLPLAAYLAEENVRFIHAARVSTRRASAALRLFKVFLPKKPGTCMKATVREVRDSMGEARDLDVYLQRFCDSGDSGAVRFRRRLERKRFKAQFPIIECAAPLLEKRRLRRRVAKLVERTAGGQDQSFKDWAHGKVREQWSIFLAAVPGDKPAALELHQFRIAGKRFRYAIELLSGGLPSVVREEVYPQITQLQSQLGEIQDHAVAAKKLRKWKKKLKRKRDRKMITQFEQDELEQFAGKSAAFTHWWRRERIEGIREVVANVCDC